MPARSARAARVRGPRKLPVSGAPYARAAAPRRSDAGGLGSPVGRSCFCLPRAARRDRGRRRTTISCLHEKRCVAAGASTTRTGGRTSSGCGFRWGRLPIGEIDHIWACAAALRHRVAARRCRSMARRRWGAFSCVFAAYLGASCTSTCTFYFLSLSTSLSVSLELVRNTRRRRPFVCQEWYESRISF